MCELCIPDSLMQDLNCYEEKYEEEYEEDKALSVSSISNDEIWEDEIGSVYCFGGGGFVWLSKD